MGRNILESGFSFLGGMAHTQDRIATRVMAHKLLPPVWWFLPGFVYRNIGIVGSAVSAIGAVWLGVLALRPRADTDVPTRRAHLIVFAWLAIAVLVSLQYFQAARKLMPLYPALASVAVMGFDRVGIWGVALVARLRQVSSSQTATVGILGVLLAAHAASFGPAAVRSFHARRDVGYMRAYLEQHGIERILVMPTTLEASMAPVQSRLQGLERKWANSHDYIVLHRLFPGPGGSRAELLDRIRKQKPVVAFENQAAVPMFWYEFPLNPDFMDPADPLTHHRALYRWRDVRPTLQRFLTN